MARKVFKKKSTAKKAAKGRPVYKVKKGYSLGKKRRAKRRKR